MTPDEWISLCASAGFAPDAGFPPGTSVHVFSGLATGHGRLRAGTPVPVGQASYQFGGRTPAGSVVIAGWQKHSQPPHPTVVREAGVEDAKGFDVPCRGSAGGWYELRVPGCNRGAAAVYGRPRGL